MSETGKPAALRVGRMTSSVGQACFGVLMSSDPIARRFRISHAPTLRSSTPGRSPITISRVACADVEHGLSRSVPVEDAYVANITVIEMLSADISIQGRVMRRGVTPPGGLYLFNFQTDPICNFHSAFDFVRFYISRQALEYLAEDNDVSPGGSLARPPLGAVDPILFNLACAALPALAHAEGASQLFVDYLALAFHAHVLATYAGPCLDIRRARAALSPWQVRTATELIASRLDGKMSIIELARACHLSQSYFSRAFLQTLGMPPHRYLLHRRIDRAKSLMNTGSEPLPVVAKLCGFATQSHFTRVFTAIEGVSPGRWRRRNESTYDDARLN